MAYTAKAAITSDLHHGITSPVRILTLRNEILTHNPDIILIAGYIGEPAKEFDKCLALFAGLTCPVGVVIGNHDIYATDGNHSEDLWLRTLPDIVRKHNLIWMEEENIVIGDTAFVGTVAWYDYSAKFSKYAHLPDHVFYQLKYQLVADGKYIDWKRKDTEFAAELREGFLKRLNAAQQDENVRRIIVITHVPLFREQMISQLGDSREADAYFGNLTLGQEVRKYPKVTDVISGHTHRPVDTKVENIGVQIVPGDYRKPGYVIVPF